MPVCGYMHVTCREPEGLLLGWLSGVTLTTPTPFQTYTQAFGFLCMIDYKRITTGAARMCGAGAANRAP